MTPTGEPYQHLVVERKGHVGWLVWGHPDQEEGPRAFAEKREARWET